MKKFIWVIPGLMVSVLLIAGCGGGAKKDKIPDPSGKYHPAYGDTLVEGTIADPAILNPVLASDSASHAVTGMIFNSLLRYDKNLKLVGEAAEKWEISRDGKVITFQLKKNVKWQDGKPLTARDVKFTLETYLNPTVKTAYRSNYTDIEKYAALDEHTFQARYREPFAPALEKLGGMPILPEHLLQGRDINTADDFNYKPVGSGPYKFLSWKRAEAVALEANPEYFEKPPYISRVIYRVVPDKSVQFMELQNGGLDMMDLTPHQYQGKGKTPDFTKRFNKYRYSSNQYTYLAFNLKKPIFQDKRFRLALALAINQKALVNGVLEGLGQEGTGPYTPSSWAYNSRIKPIPYDPDRSRKLFVEAGYQYSTDGTLMRGSKPVEFTILTNQGNRNREQTATIIQSQLKEVGININIRIIAWSTLLSEFVNKRKFDALIMGWSLARDPDLYGIWHSSMTGEHEFNFVSYSNPAVDRLLIKGRKTFDRKQRTGIYNQVHEIIAADVPYVFLFVPDSLPAVHRRVLGIKPELAGIGYNFIKWYVPEGFHKYQK